MGEEVLNDKRLKMKYALTPEHRAELKPWAEKWIANAMSCKPIDDADRKAMKTAIVGMYNAAGLTPPQNIVFVSSPLAARVSAGFAAALWYLRDLRVTESAMWGATRGAMDAATRDAIWAATDAATEAATAAAMRDATWAATWNATEAATWAATWDATRDATRTATRDATWSATEAATWIATNEATRTVTEVVMWATTRAATEAATAAATRDATEGSTRDATEGSTRDATWATIKVATDVATWAATWAATWTATEAATRTAMDAATLSATEAATSTVTEAATEAASWIASLAQRISPDHAEFLTHCASIASAMSNPGNHLSGPVAFLSFFRHVAKLNLRAYEAWQHYESAAIHGSWRYMHPKFCIVSDRPEYIRIDNQRRPHCETGPSHRWRDGWELYHWHGTRIPREWITDRASLTAQVALTWTNIEQRRAACEILGWDNILQALDARTVDDSGDPEIGVLLEIDIPDIGRERFLRVQCGTGRQFALPVPPDMQTAMQANAWTYGLKEAEFFKPEVRT